MLFAHTSMHKLATVLTVLQHCGMTNEGPQKCKKTTANKSPRKQGVPLALYELIMWCKLKAKKGEKPWRKCFHYNSFWLYTNVKSNLLYLPAGI